MLKGIPSILGPDLLAVLRAMGHGDEIAIVDGNYPAAAHAQRLVRLDGHGAPAVLDAILTLLPLDTGVPQAAFRPCAFGDCARMESVFEEFRTVIDRHQTAIKLTPLEGEAFYARVRGAYAIVATSEPRLYGNIVLRKGVILPDGSVKA
jgi:L-fucose mutarotase